MITAATSLQAVPVSTIGEQVGRATPIYAIGDSHCLGFGDLIHNEPEHYEQYFVARSKFIAGFRAREFADGSGNLGPAVVNALASEGLLLPTADGAGQPFHQSASSVSNAIVEARGFGRTSPILVFFCGATDMHETILRQLAPGSDFVAPDEAGNAEPVLPAYRVDRVIPYESIFERCQEVLQPLFLGLKRLRSMGFTNIFLHALPPPTVDDEAFERTTGYAAPAALRYKVARLFNTIFTTFARENDRSRGIRILDVWPSITVGGALDPVFALGDHVHLNERAAALSIGSLLDDMVHRPHVPAIRSLWEVATSQAVADFAAARPFMDQELAARFARDNIVVLDAGSEFAGKLHGAVEFGFDSDTRNRHLRLDWSGDPVEVHNALIRSATPSQAVLDTIYERLLCGELRDQISACMGSRFTIPQLKIYKSFVSSVADGPQTYHRDANPAGTLRGILYLVDVDEDAGPFEYIDDAGVSHKITGPAGTLIVFDGKRYVHRAVPPRGKVRESLDITFAVLVRGSEPVVMWPGMNNWPVDPFLFSTRGFVTSSGMRSAARSGQ